VSGYAGSLMGHGTDAALVALALFIVLLALYTLRVRAGLRVPLRHVTPYRLLPDLAERSTETGAPVVTWLASQSAPLRTNSPVALLLAMNVLQSNRERNGFHSSYQPSELQFYGASQMAFAGGVALDPGPNPRAATLLAGTFEGEGLWLGTSMRDVDAPALTVSGDPAGDALVAVARAANSPSSLRSKPYAGTGPLLPGEDLYAAGAYLQSPKALGSLLAQDAARWLIIAVVLVAVVLTSLGYGG
jgi:hypothetical protein